MPENFDQPSSEWERRERAEEERRKRLLAREVVSTENGDDGFTVQVRVGRDHALSIYSKIMPSHSGGVSALTELTMFKINTKTGAPAGRIPEPRRIQAIKNIPDAIGTISSIRDQMALRIDLRDILNGLKKG